MTYTWQESEAHRNKYVIRQSASLTQLKEIIF